MKQWTYIMMNKGKTPNRANTRNTSPGQKSIDALQMAFDVDSTALSPPASMKAAAIKTIAYSLGSTNLLNLDLSTGIVIKNILPMDTPRIKRKIQYRQ